MELIPTLNGWMEGVKWNLQTQCFGWSTGGRVLPDILWPLHKENMESQTVGDFVVQVKQITSTYSGNAHC